jgi:HTH-type transcriptional regulator/antitoxin HipB
MATPIRTPFDLGAWIRERRTKLGLDQLTLARKAGTSRKWLIEVESGKPRAEIGLIFRTLKALGATVIIGESEAATEAMRAASATPAIDIDQIIHSLKKPR